MISVVFAWNASHTFLQQLSDANFFATLTLAGSAGHR
jgi:hypothetical protein